MFPDLAFYDNSIIEFQLQGLNIDKYNLDTLKNNSVEQSDQQVNKLLDSNYLFWLGGFVEGEGSLSVAIIVGQSYKFGIHLQPSFTVTQHVRGISILESFLKLFDGKGSLHLKSGSPDVWVYELKGTKNLITYVFPFFLKYVIPFSCKQSEFKTFKAIVLGLEAKKHLELDTLADLIKLAYSYVGKGNNRKRTLNEVLDILKDKESYFNKTKTDETLI